MTFQTVRGMRDFLPKKAKKKQFIEDLCRKTFESYGFEPLQTPIVEDFGLLAAKGSAGEAIKDEVYYFKDKGERELGLRFDFTVPLARICSSNKGLGKPFRRYCIGTVYRYDRPQAKRYREFTQADADIVGAKSVLADFECVQIAVDVMRKLGLEFKIAVNNSGVLESLAKVYGMDSKKAKDAFRSVDKLDKIGEKGVRKELEEKGIDTSFLDTILVNSLDVVKEKAGENEAVKELEKLLELSQKNGFEEVSADLSLARGLEYYTGNVFEIKLENGPSVGAGGRYDKLIGNYGGEESPAVGISFGIDRLFDALEETLVIGSNTDVFVVPLGEEMNGAAVLLASKIRSAGISAEVDVMQRNLKKNFEYAEKKGISFLIILGENEVREKKFKIKRIGSKEEKEVSFDDLKELVEFVKH